jgi:hypothetical protein
MHAGMRVGVGMVGVCMLRRRVVCACMLRRVVCACRWRRVMHGRHSIPAAVVSDVLCYSKLAFQVKHKHFQFPLPHRVQLTTSQLLLGLFETTQCNQHQFRWLRFSGETHQHVIITQIKLRTQRSVCMGVMALLAGTV